MKGMIGSWTKKIAIPLIDRRPFDLCRPWRQRRQQLGRPNVVPCSIGGEQRGSWPSRHWLVRAWLGVSRWSAMETSLLLVAAAVKEVVINANKSERNKVWFWHRVTILCHLGSRCYGNSSSFKGKTRPLQTPRDRWGRRYIMAIGRRGKVTKKRRPLPTVL